MECSASLDAWMDYKPHSGWLPPKRPMKPPTEYVGSDSQCPVSAHDVTRFGSRRRGVPIPLLPLAVDSAGGRLTRVRLPWVAPGRSIALVET
jgi:hypothetical protein